MLVRSAGNAGHGPSWIFGVWPPASLRIFELLAAGNDHVGAVELAAEPEPLEHEPDHPQVLGNVSLTSSSPPVTPASAMNEPISMWSGAIVVCAAAQAGRFRERSSRSSRSRRSWRPSRRASARGPGRAARDAALRITVVPRRQRGGHQRVLGRHHRRLVHQEVTRAQAERGRLEFDVALALDGRAERAERVEVRIEPPAADHVAAGRRHQARVRTARAAGRRAGTRRGSARRARGRPRCVDGGGVDARPRSDRAR